MTYSCDEIRNRLLSDDDLTLDAELQRHLKECHECAALYAALNAVD